MAIQTAELEKNSDPGRPRTDSTSFRVKSKKGNACAENVVMGNCPKKRHKKKEKRFDGVQHGHCFSPAGQLLFNSFRETFANPADPPKDPLQALDQLIFFFSKTDRTGGGAISCSDFQPRFSLSQPTLQFVSKLKENFASLQSKKQLLKRASLISPGMMEILNWNWKKRKFTVA